MSAPGINLTVAGGGMTRLRTKGAAAQNSLYQLTNGYVTQAQTVKVRPGTFRAENLAALGGANATVGLAFYKDVFNVFSDTLVDVPIGYRCNVLQFPSTQPSDIIYGLTKGVLATSGSTVVGVNSDAGEVHQGPASPSTAAPGFALAGITNSFQTAGSITPTTIGAEAAVIYGLFLTDTTSIDDPSHLYFITDTNYSPPAGTTLTYPKQGGGTNTVAIDSAALTSALDLGSNFVVWSWDVSAELPDFSASLVDITITGADAAAAIPVKKIHFAAPFMGFLYVVAEFDVTDSATLAKYGDTFHFWLQSSGAWTADTVYLPNDIVSPTVDNGLGFQATRLTPPNSTWSANTQITLDQIVEPNTPNGYMFKAIAVEGSNPHTGTVEPTWPTKINGTIQEFGDFSALDTTDPTTGAAIQAPSTVITDRYGNPYTAPPDNATGTAVPTVTASTKISSWAPGVLTFPGAVVQPSTSQGAFINAIPNGDFESGDDGSWVFNSPWAIDSTAGHAYKGTHCAQFDGAAATAQLVMNSQVAVTPGQSVSITAYLNPNNSGANLTFVLQLLWYKADTTTLISTSASGGVQGAGYRPVVLTASAPAEAAFCVAAVQGESGTSHRNPGYADYISWNLETPAASSQFLFEAIQADAGTTGTTEPAWPDSSGDTVTDGGVTWEAVGASIITWQALPIMESGDSEPTWPTTVGLAVADGNMSWTCVSRQVTDPNCPQSKVVAIGQSKVYAVDNDTIPFCATTNPLDWTTQFDAGYLPFGIQTYGSEPCAALGLYRSNLVAMNSLGYQMWQIDPDPANMALLDAQPVGCTYPLSVQPVQNDLVFLTTRGIRSLGISGASGNVQAGQFGKNLDPLVLESIAAGGEPLGEPVGLFYPGTGQYWLIFGTTVYVQTNNGSGNANSWSVYEFPDPISYWTVADGELYVRAGDLVWHVHEDALYDDIQDASHPGSNSVPFTGAMSWPYLDLGKPGVDKDFEGINLTCTGTGTLSIGYDQSNFSLATTPIAFDGDTLPGIGMIPIPMVAPSFQVQLTWDPGQAWEWNMTSIYINQEAGT